MLCDDGGGDTGNEGRNNGIDNHEGNASNQETLLGDIREGGGEGGEEQQQQKQQK